jgi:hypothetical protein
VGTLSSAAIARKRSRWYKVRELEERMLIGLLVACNGGGIGEYQGVRISEYFPQDGTRIATYINEDTNVVYKLQAEKFPEPARIDERDVFTWDYYQKTDDEQIKWFSVQWAAPAGDGAYIYGYAEGDASITPYDPPIQIGPIDDTMKNGEEVVTETGGATWTSTLIASEDCPVEWGTLEWDQCQHLSVNDGTPDNAPLFEGEYWQVTSYGTAWFLPAGATSKWVLLDYEWDAEE